MTEASMESDGIDVFVVYNGTRIAKRADPKSPQAGTWVSLEPGYPGCLTRVTLENWSLSAITKLLANRLENLVHCICLLLAQNGHTDALKLCPLLGIKRKFSRGSVACLKLGFSQEICPLVVLKSCLPRAE